jgi:hypothetical protein
LQCNGFDQKEFDDDDDRRLREEVVERRFSTDSCRHCSPSPSTVLPMMMAKRFTSEEVSAKLQTAQQLREEGLALFQAGDLSQAMHKWHSVVMYCTGLDRDQAMSSSRQQQASPSSLEPAQEKLCKELMLAAHSNLSLALFKARAPGGRRGTPFSGVLSRRFLS